MKFSFSPSCLVQYIIYGFQVFWSQNTRKNLSFNDDERDKKAETDRKWGKGENDKLGAGDEQFASVT